MCELRRAHPRWGARRIAFEVAQRGVAGAPSRATVHRVLVRNSLVTPQTQQNKRKYRRWQLDLAGGIYLADGRECKLLSGIDDHSRYVVCAAVLAVPSARAVADAFTAAMRPYGVPAEVLTDNGKQFTGWFTKPRPAEVMLERVCREHGITAKLTKPYSPTTTGKWSGGTRRCAASCLMRPGRSRTCPARRRRSPPGCTPKTAPGRIRRWTWPPRPACSGRVPSQNQSWPSRSRSQRPNPPPS